MIEKIILVDKNDDEIGIGEKIETHRSGKLHRAFSIFIFDSKGDLILQKRAKTKYHSAGLWSNTCCSHPRVGEITEFAAHRRLNEEMGFDCDLKEIFSFVYRVKFENNFSENEYVHVFIGKYDGKINPNPEEVSEWKFVHLDELQIAIQEVPDEYTYWLRIILNKLISYLKHG